MLDNMVPMLIGLLLACGLAALVAHLWRLPMRGNAAAPTHCAGCRCFPPSMAADAVIEDAPPDIPPAPRNRRAPRKPARK